LGRAAAHLGTGGVRPAQLRWAALVDEARAASDEHFGGRHRARLLHRLLQLHLFKISPSPMVSLGRGGWLHLYMPAEQACIKRLQPFSWAQLESWRVGLESQQAFLAQRGIAFFFLLAPDKHTIYPQTLRPGVLGMAPSRADQLLAHLAQHSSVVVIDPRRALQDAAKRLQVYHQTDSHWNAAGAFVAYEQTMQALKQEWPGLQPLTPDDFILEHGALHPTDLADMIGLGAVERPTEMRRRGPDAARFDWSRYAPRRTDLGRLKVAYYESRGHSDAPLGRMVMLGDSFRANLARFVAEHASHGIFVDGYELDPGLVVRHQPNLVIHQMVERWLHEGSPPPPMEAFGGVVLA
ncbi:MAG: hypothetical protein EOO40_12150, partial [Deltaproteobacteria bacterium]